MDALATFSAAAFALVLHNVETFYTPLENDPVASSDNKTQPDVVALPFQAEHANEDRADLQKSSSYSSRSGCGPETGSLRSRKRAGPRVSILQTCLAAASSSSRSFAFQFCTALCLKWRHGKHTASLELVQLGQRAGTRWLKGRLVLHKYC